jgi:hypothetical protein
LPLVLLMAVSCPLLPQSMLSSCSSRRGRAWVRGQYMMGMTWGMKAMGKTMAMLALQTQGMTCCRQQQQTRMMEQSSSSSSQQRVLQQQQQQLMLLMGRICLSGCPGRVAQPQQQQQQQQRVWRQHAKRGRGVGAGMVLLLLVMMLMASMTPTHPWTPLPQAPCL